MINRFKILITPVGVNGMINQIKPFSFSNIPQHLPIIVKVKTDKLIFVELAKKSLNNLIKLLQQQQKQQHISR